jgi:Type IV secretion-system coupling protein DNA-binding domain
MRRTYRLSFPEGLKHEQVLQFARVLSARPRHGFWRVADAVTIDVVSGAGQVGWFIGVEAREEGLVLSAVRSCLPSLTMELTDEPLPTVPSAWELRLNTTRRPLHIDAAEQVAAALLSVMAAVRVGEVVRLHWLISPWVTRQVVPSPTRRRDRGLVELDQVVRNHEEARALRDKQSEPLFAVVGRIGVSAKSEARVRHLRQRVVGALQLARAPGVGFQRRRLPSGLVRSRLDRLVQPGFGWPAILNASELASVLGWPIGNPIVENVTYSGHRQLPPPRATAIGLDGPFSRVTGQATFPGRAGWLHLAEQAGLHHLHVLGPTGTGKSTLLANMALQDIRAGRGVVVIDPGAKGDLVRDIADRIPKDRLDDVVLLDPSDHIPVGLNVLAGGEPDLVVDAVVHVFQELWAAHWGPRTADVLHHGLLTLARTPGMTLCELPPLLLNAGFRQQVLQRLGDDALGVGPFWSWYQALGDAERNTVVGPVLNKLRAFTQRQAIRSVIGQDNGIDLNKLLCERKVLLVDLGSGSLGSETAQLLGALIMATLWQAITSRSHLTADERRPTFVYIDEFQQTLRLPMDLTDALVQARGLGVGLVLAHQHLGQLPPSVKSSLLGNAGSRVVFGLRAADAGVMAKELGGGITADDLQGLPAYETYQSLHIVGQRARPASARTTPLTPSMGSGGQVRTLSRERFGMPRAEVDAVLRKRRDGVKASAPVGSRRRGGTS